MATDVTRDELAAALADTGVIVGEPRLLRGASDDGRFLANVIYPGALAEELLAHIEDGRKHAGAAQGQEAHRSRYCRWCETSGHAPCPACKVYVCPQHHACPRDRPAETAEETEC